MDQLKRIVVVYSPNSTRAKRYRQIYHDLLKYADRRRVTLIQIELDNIPYSQAAKLIISRIADGDLVVAAGGDGIAQVVAQSIYSAKVEAIFTTIPLGNSNDISRAFNGHHRSVATILSQSTTQFYPLNVAADGKVAFTLISYVTFGATTVLVECLNRDSSRRLRSRFKNITPAVAIPVGELGKLSRAISRLDFPDFSRGSKQVMTDDSIGFFLLPAAHNVLRLPKDVTLADSEFFFHHSITKDKNLGRKIIMAGAWTFKFPGEMTELEELDFGDNTSNIVANVSGDNLNLGPVRRIAAIRSTRPIKILFNK